MFRTPLACLLATICLALAPCCPGAAFIKFDGVDGEVTDVGHAGWSGLLSFSHRAQRIGGTTREATTVVDPFVVSKELDKSSPKLAEAVLSGKPIPAVTLHDTRTLNGARQVYLSYELKNVLVSSYSMAGNGSGDATPTEQLSLNFEEIKVTYTIFDAAGRKTGEVSTTYKVPASTP